MSDEYHWREAKEIFRRKKKRIQNAHVMIGYVRDDLNASSMDNAEKEALVIRINKILHDLALTDDQSDLEDVIRSKEQRIKNAFVCMKAVTEEIKASHLEHKNREYLLNQIDNILTNVLRNEDESNSKWNSKTVNLRSNHWSKKYISYLRFVMKHKWFVFLECCKYGLVWQGIIHDWTKFLPIEMKARANFFYGKEKNQQAFDIAWLHHQKMNKHHWEWWVLTHGDGSRTPYPIPDRYRKEMIADWRGTSRSVKGIEDAKGYYLANREKILLHDETRSWVEKELGIE